MSVNWSLNRTLLVSVVFLLSFSSCRKERLKDDKEFLIGNWEWVYSARKIPCGCGDPSDHDTINPLTEGDTYSMEFKKKGKIFFYKNDEIINKKRIVFYKWPNTGKWLDYFESGRSFGIRLNNNKDSVLQGHFSTEGDISEIDSVFFESYFPFKREYKNGITISYFSLFVKR